MKKSTDANDKHALSKHRPAPQIKCSWEGCFKWSILRAEIEPGKGMHILCEQHYVEACHLASSRRISAKGLHTEEQMREYCRRAFRSALDKMTTSKTRIPGEDDE